MISAVPALPANTGAVPATATFPVTAAPHVAAVLTASAGGVSAHALLVLGSPITIAEYAANCAVVIASHVAGVATVTVTPEGTPSASALDDPPFTLVERISTDCPVACAAAGRVTATATDPAAATAAVTATGTGTGDIATTGASPAATTRRTPGSTRRSTRWNLTPTGTPLRTARPPVMKNLGSIWRPLSPCLKQTIASPRGSNVESGCKRTPQGSSKPE